MLRFGPAGWTYKDWEGIVYPPHGSRFDHLGYLASYFDTIEVNSSFYRIPPPAHAHSWTRRTAFNADFRFTVKLFRGQAIVNAIDLQQMMGLPARVPPPMVEMMKERG